MLLYCRTSPKRRNLQPLDHLTFLKKGVLLAALPGVLLVALLVVLLAVLPVVLLAVLLAVLLVALLVALLVDFQQGLKLVQT
tara:strand:+ start:382 stop:627 length:246 start_codon:yes stop_codon:yes gene_type:complete